MIYEKFKIALFYEQYGNANAGGTTVRSYNIVKMLNKFGFNFKCFVGRDAHPDYNIPNRIFRNSFKKEDYNIYWVEQGYSSIINLNMQGISPILGTNIIPNSPPQHSMPYVDDAGLQRLHRQIESEKNCIKDFKYKFWLSQSDFQEKEYRRLGLPYNIPVYRAFNPIDLDIYTPQIERPNKPIFGWTGKPNWAKHPSFLADIAKQLPNIEFRYFSDENTPMNLGNNVKVITGKTNKEMPNRLKECSFFLSTSVTENQPLGVLEAMAIGLPVIGFRTSGMPEIIKENETGILVDLGNIEHFIVEINRLIANPQKQQYLIKNARKYIEDNFAEDKVINQFISIFNHYLGE